MAEPSFSVVQSRRRWVICAFVLLAAAVAAWWFIDASTQRRLLVADIDALPANADLMAFAVPRGRAAFAAHCESCHASGRGAPDLADRDWLYGTGMPSDVERIVAYGIRSNHPKSWNLATMPPYGRDAALSNLLKPAEVDDLIEFLMVLQGDAANADAAQRGKAVYNGRGGCFDCHARDGQGDPAVGAPNLTDRIWLYGSGGHEDLRRSIVDGRHGMCPAWSGTLPSFDVRAIALYVSSLSAIPSPELVK